MWLFHWKEKKKAKILSDLNSYISDSKNKAEKAQALKPSRDTNEELVEEKITESTSKNDDIISSTNNTPHYRKRLSDDYKPNPDVRKNLSDNYGESNDTYLDFKTLFEEPKMTVSKYIIYFINDKNLKDSDVYKRANLSRQYFNSVMNDRIKIGKEKALALCIGLKLDINEANVLLKAAGYAFSPIEVDDLVYKYSIEHKIYNINFIKELIIEYSNKVSK